jgi:tetratricopeptide (TPR) repeat protein
MFWILSCLYLLFPFARYMIRMKNTSLYFLAWVLLLAGLATSCQSKRNPDAYQPPLSKTEMAKGLYDRFLYDTTQMAVLDSSLMYINEAIKEDTSNIKVYGIKATILCKMKKYKEAILALQPLTSRPDAAPEALTYQGTLYERTGQLDTATIVYKKAIAAYERRMQTEGQNRIISDKAGIAFVKLFTEGKEAAKADADSLSAEYPGNKTISNLQNTIDKFDRAKYIAGL